MKKQYIVPAIYGHKLRVESQILANSPTQTKLQSFGNKGKSQETITPSEVGSIQADFGPRVIESVEDVEGGGTPTSNI